MWAYPFMSIHDMLKLSDPQWREIKQRMLAIRNLDSTIPTRRYYGRLYKEALDGWGADCTTDPTVGDPELTTRLAQLELDLQTRSGQYLHVVDFEGNALESLESYESKAHAARQGVEAIRSPQGRRLASPLWGAKPRKARPIKNTNETLLDKLD